MKMGSFPVIDLHCDLLSYLCDKPGRMPHDPASHCSTTQMRAGNVKVQTLAIYAETKKHSSSRGNAQAEAFRNLLQKHLLDFAPFSGTLDESSPIIHLLYAFENASSFAEEDEPLTASLSRLENHIEKIGSPLYISLTWNGENRFGGGCGSSAGLKKDGRHLMEWMSHKKIALDLSHASDRLSEEVIDTIEANAYTIPLIASHSNYREVTHTERNLPDAIAKEIIRRKGLIGLNLFRPFIHKTDPSTLLRHVEYALHLSGQDAICFGADFFCDTDFPDLLEKHQTTSAFFSEYADASKYSNILSFLQNKLSLREEQLQKIAYGNALNFIKTASCWLPCSEYSI